MRLCRRAVRLRWRRLRRVFGRLLGNICPLDAPSGQAEQDQRSQKRREQAPDPHWDARRLGALAIEAGGNTEARANRGEQRRSRRRRHVFVARTEISNRRSTRADPLVGAARALTLLVGRIFGLKAVTAAVDERANVAIDAIKSVARDPSGQGGTLEFFVIASVLARECERRAVAGEDVRSTYIVAALAR